MSKRERCVRAPHAHKCGQWMFCLLVASGVFHSCTGSAEPITIDPRIDDHRTSRFAACAAPNSRVPLEGYVDPALARRACEAASSAARSCGVADGQACAIEGARNISAGKVAARLERGVISWIRADRDGDKSIRFSVSFGSDRPGAYEAILYLRVRPDGTVEPESWAIRLP
jgi:hypothetical protein